jgi:ABC-type multidrug transport system fused ATPase/permease subunit
VKYCYCPDCDSLRPRNWYARRDCEICGKECVSIVVKRTIFGQLMYLLDAIALALIVLYAAYYQFNSDWASFFSAVSSDVAVILIFALIILSFIFAFIDLTKTTAVAQQKVETIRRERPAHKIQR